MWWKLETYRNSINSKHKNNEENHSKARPNQITQNQRRWKHLKNNQEKQHTDKDEDGS